MNLCLYIDFLHLWNQIYVWQIKFIVNCLYSKRREILLVVVEHFWCRKIREIICRVPSELYIQLCLLFYSHWQPLGLEKMSKAFVFDDIAVIQHNCWGILITRSKKIYDDDSSIFSFFIKGLCIINTSLENSTDHISSVKAVSKCLSKIDVLTERFLSLHTTSTHRDRNVYL